MLIRMDLIERLFIAFSAAVRFLAWILATVPVSEQPDKDEEEKMGFCMADHVRWGLTPPVSVQISRRFSTFRLYTFSPMVYGNTGKYEFNIPMDPEEFLKTQFRLFVFSSEGWVAAPGKDKAGTTFYRVYTTYAAGWARIFLLPSAEGSSSEWTVKVRVLTMTMEAQQVELDLRNYQQVCSLFGPQKECRKSEK